MQWWEVCFGQESRSFQRLWVWPIVNDESCFLCKYPFHNLLCHKCMHEMQPIWLNSNTFGYFLCFWTYTWVWYFQKADYGLLFWLWLLSGRDRGRSLGRIRTLRDWWESGPQLLIDRKAYYGQCYYFSRTRPCGWILKGWHPSWDRKMKKYYTYLQTPFLLSMGPTWFCCSLRYTVTYRGSPFKRRTLET